MAEKTTLDLVLSPTFPWVLGFAMEMERKLEANREKGNREGWRNLDGAALLELMRAEVDEAEAASELASCTKMANPQLDSGAARRWRSAVVSECADVGNFAMMLADREGEMQASDLLLRLWGSVSGLHALYQRKAFVFGPGGQPIGCQCRPGVVNAEGAQVEHADGCVASPAWLLEQMRVGGGYRW